MRNNSTDSTLKKNYIQKYQYLIAEYESVKSRTHRKYKFAKDFYAAHNTCPQTFLKYYARYKQSDNPEDLLPAKRGPKYRTRRTDPKIEEFVLKERAKGCNKYEISSILSNELGNRAPSPSGVYKILKRHGKNKLTTKNKEEKRKIIKEKAGELGHVDCHHLSKDLIANESKKYYLVAVIDSCTRIAWVEVIEDIKALSVMFACLRCMNHIKGRYDFKFAELLTDNGPEFGPKSSSKRDDHPFERLCMELGAKHRHTRPYRPQTNGKVERFWRTLNEDLIDGTYFESFEHFKQELLDYMIYYNQLRPHQALNGETPQKFAEKCQRIM
jgi:transposase InsO family protein